MLQSLQDINDLTSLSFDYKYATVEAAIGATLQMLKKLSGNFRSILPMDIYLQSLALLTDAFVTHLISLVFSVTQLSLEDLTSLVHLLSSIISQCMPIIEAHRYTRTGEPSSSIRTQKTVQGYMQNWESFCLVQRLLDADFATFYQSRDKINQLFAHSQIRKILGLNPTLSHSVDDCYEALTQQE